ncbi:MAG: diacylglycerol kinase family lipid kinase [Chloroflexi bacterium]|nr:diacylglycerol kinase family lipid kinase [Chloroflexota bacterium]
MANKKTLLIINPNADLGRAWRWAADLRPIADEFGGADWTGTVYPTHATELARQAGEQGYALVIAVGGDGTVHEVINGLMQVPAERRPRLGVVPMGSGNDFAHSMGMDTRPAYALRQALTASPHRVDIGKLQDNLGRTEYFDNTVGIGFDATVTIRSRNFPYLRGFLIYLLAVLQTVILNHEAPRMKVTSDQESFSEEMLMLVLCNGGREGGGFQVAPQARNQDGRLDYVAIRRVSRLMMLRLIPEVMNGTHLRFKQVRSGVFQRLELQSDHPLLIHTDGEIFAGFGVDVRSLSLEILPQAIEVMA